MPFRTPDVRVLETVFRLFYMADTQAIKDRVDIVQLIQEYLPLKKAGANWKAPCPFHHEKTPSFMVHPEKQIWHCFGCGKGGDVFTFIQDIEGLEFAEALKLLADRAGIKLENNFQNEVNRSQKNRIFDINSKAAVFFHRFLMEMPAAAEALKYLTNNRGLKQQTIIDWQIGFIPDQWDLLTKYFLNKGIGIDDLVASGLTVKNDERKSYYDRFRGRIMFPICNVHGDVAGFTGRILVETENSGGKYVNTPQTIVYDKSRIIYGLNKAKLDIKAKDYTVLVEGQMDVIACHEAGMTNVVAASGTALTDDQVRLLKRYSNNVMMAFDADTAGDSAAKRGIDLAMSEGMNIKIVQIPKDAGKDADECIRKNPKIWFESIKNALGIMDWYFKKTLAGVDLSDPKKKQQAASALVAEIAKIPYSIEREAWLKKLGETLSVSFDVLQEAAKKIKSAPAPKAGINPQPVVVELPSNNKLNLLMEKFWSLITKSPPVFSALHASIQKEYFTGTAYSGLYEFCEKQYNNNATIDFSTLAEPILNAKGENLTDLLYMQAEKDYTDWTADLVKKEADLIIQEIGKGWRKSERERLLKELQKAQSDHDAAKENELLKLIMELQN